jgi:PBP1b-binding outer membrane lipoprotein LpoB
MSRKLLAVAALAIMLAGCVVVPARPVYYRPAPVVIY